MICILMNGIFIEVAVLYLTDASKHDLAVQIVLLFVQIITGIGVGIIMGLIGWPLKYITNATL